MFVTSKEMLEKAQRGAYAVGAFNVENMEMVMAVIDAAEEAKAPVILQTTPSTVKYGKIEVLGGCAIAAAKAASVPVCVHLDHGDSFDLALSALNGGYSSVMIDGSKLSFNENVELTKAVCSKASGFGVPVEAELGKLGGKEDSLVSDGDEYTDPAQAAEFCERTGVDSLAVSIGTAHGIYSKTPALDVGRLAEIRKTVSVPLVLHGASGLSDDAVRNCISNGICKVNFATELRIAFTNALRSEIASNATFDPKPLMKPAIAAVKAKVLERMEVCGCCGKA